MQSSGGVVELEDAAERAASCVLSGPAGGVVGAAFAARASGFEDVLTFDMGGTSTDVAPVVGGEVQTTTDAGRRRACRSATRRSTSTRCPRAAGRSRRRTRAARCTSARAARAPTPGPAAYGKGGTEPTVTDANLLLGYLRDGAELGGGEVVLDRERAEAALGELGSELGLDAVEARARRRRGRERGDGPRAAGHQRAARPGPARLRARRLRRRRARCTPARSPRSSRSAPSSSRARAACSARSGLAISDLRRDVVAPHPAVLEDVDRDAVEEAFAALERQAAEGLDGATCTRAADVRYRRQSFELTVPGRRLGRPRRALPRRARAPPRLRDARRAARARGAARHGDGGGRRRPS